MMIIFGLVISAIYFFTSKVTSNLHTVRTNYIYYQINNFEKNDCRIT